MNLARAGRGFESNPFRWNIPEARRSHSTITFLWSYRNALEGPLYSFTSSRLDHVLERRLIPIPSELSQRDVELYNYLLSAAEHETRATKAPCLYLGVERSPGSFEPDPANWQEEPERKSHCYVWFEWQHVRHGDSPHRVRCSVHHIKHHHRAVPLNPLRTTCPTNMTFSVEWMQAVATSVGPGITYKGIAYEGDRPVLFN